MSIDLTHTDEQDEQRSENEGMRGPADNAALSDRPRPKIKQVGAENAAQAQSQLPAEWISEVNHRQGQFWQGGPRPMNAPPPQRAGPSRSTLFERKDATSNGAGAAASADKS